MATNLARKLVKNWPGRKEQWNDCRSAGCFVERLYFGDFAAAATTGNKDLTHFPGGLVLEDCFIWLVTEFSGGAVSAATVSVGTTGTADAYLTATNVWTGAGALTILSGHTAFTTGLFLNSSSPTSEGTVRVQMLTTSANTNALTAGALDLHLCLRSHRLPNK